MRFDHQRQKVTLEELLRRIDKDTLAKNIRRFGGERFAGPISRNILKYVNSSKVSQVSGLVKFISESQPAFYRRKIFRHPAKRTFQALRIMVNNELEELQKGIKRALDSLPLGGKMAVIYFHSLEGKIVIGEVKS